MSAVELHVDRHEDHLEVTWSDVRSSGSCRFDRVVDTSPEWLGPAAELFEDADRRQERRIVDALAAWASAADLQVGIWHDDAGVELLS